MIETNHISQVWNELDRSSTFGTSKRLYSDHLPFHIYGILQNPEHLFGIGFSFSKNIRIDISPFKNLKSLLVRVVNDSSFDNHQLLIVQVTDESNKSIFSVLCDNLILSVLEINNEITFVKTILNQLERWRILFSKKKGNGLSSSEQIGLWGELYFLEKLLSAPESDKMKIVESWSGPSMAPRDFQINNNAVEVKTTSINNTDIVIINGARQLDETHLDSLFLYHCSVDYSSGTISTLNEKIESIRILLQNELTILSIFESKLFEAGYLNEQAELYANKSITLRKEECYKVNSEFPRIKEDEVRSGINGITYEINLATCNDYRVHISQLTSLFTA